ncbi:MAG: alpha/beta fold hydrolase [Colwellia sp.]
MTEQSSTARTQLPLYFLPGTLCNADMFKAQISALKDQNVNVITIDFSTQRSIDEMVETTLKVMNNRPGNLCGFSMGGLVALALAKKHPKLVARLCLMSSNCHADIPEKKALREEHVKQAKELSLQAILQKFYLPNYLYQDNDKHFQTISTMAETLGIECFEAQLAALSTREDTLSVLQNITCPVTIIAGENDKLCTKAHQLHMHEHCNNSDLFLLNQCGHFPMLERESTVLTLLEDWLTR